jgi:hypothetical protein
MLKIWLIHIAFLSIGITTRAQTITIISAHTNEPLPFATIQNLRVQSAVVSSEKGTFSFNETNSKTGDTMLITYTGYNPIRMIKPDEDKVLKMEPLAVMLQPVVVLPCRGMKKQTLNNFKKSKVDWSLGSSEEALATWAAYIPNKDKVKGILSSIQFWIKYFDIPKTAKGAPYKIKLLKYNEASGLPDEPLLLKELIVYPNAQKIVINVSEEWLRLPENGIVVVIDFFYAGEQYVHSHKVKQFRSDGSSVDTVMNRYGSSIEAARADNLVGNGFTYSYKRNEWSEVKNSTREKLAPKIELTLKLCD